MIKNEISFKRKVLLTPKWSTAWAIKRSQGKRTNERNVLSCSSVHDIKDLTIQVATLQEKKSLRPCEAPKLVDGFQRVESGKKDIPSIGLVVGCVLGPNPQEVKRGLDAPFTFVYGMAGFQIKAWGAE